MKKKLLFVAIILILLAGILYYISLPDYLVFNSMSFSNGANRDTELQVIVYQYWNTDEVVAEIEAEHNQINGTPTTLTINLYHSKWSFHNGYEPFYTTTINYDWKGKADSPIKKLSATNWKLLCQHINRFFLCSNKKYILAIITFIHEVL
mgnify:CR=1 FL=1